MEKRRFRYGAAPLYGPVFFILSVYSGYSRADHAAIGIGVGTATPIGTESAVTLPRDHLAIGLRAEYIEFDEYSDSKLIELREQDEEADLHSVESLINASIGLFYGVTDNLTVGLRIPYVRRNDIREPEGEHGHGHEDGEEEGEAEDIIVAELGGSEGLGDISFFGQYRFFHKTDIQSDVSALFGVKAPTGDTTERANEGFRLETELQPGSGSWDGLMGLAYTQIFGPFAFDTNVLYTVVSEGSQDTDLGDIFDYNFALSYRLGAGHPDTFFTEPGRFAWDLILELNGEWRDKEEVSGSEDDNSGGNIVYLSPGVRLTGGRRWSLAASFGYPVVTDLNGDQVDPDYRVLSSLSFAF